MKKIMIQSQFQDWMQKEVQQINEALQSALMEIPPPCRPIAAHILKAGGKRMRPLLTVLCARMFGYTRKDIYRLGASLEMLHAATLLHDDILDNADTRRGQQAAHIIFGTTRTVLAGDALLACGNALVASYGKSSLTLCYSLATSQTAAGEILEMDSLGRADLDQEQYLRIARGKTGCLISQACAMGALMADAAAQQVEECAKYGENLGLAFQIVDDALDFAPASQTGKPSGGDLREGKMTPPIRLYRQSLNAEERVRFDEAFASSCFEGMDFEFLVKQIGKFIVPTLDLARSCVEHAKDALATLPRGEENEILGQMADYVLCRTS